MTKHNYAQQILKHYGLTISIGEHSIPSKETEITYDFSQEFKTSFILNRHLSIVKKAIRQIEYEDLIKLGYQITRRSASGKYFKYQRVEYAIIKKNQMVYDLGRIPKDHILEYNYQEGWLRLVGQNSMGRKVFTHRQEYIRKINPKTMEDLNGIYESYVAKLSPWTFEEQEKRKQIKEIALIVTDDGRLICLPQTKDLPKIGIFGKTGTGKTIAMHMLVDGVHQKWKKRCFVGNDGVSFQTKSWSLPWDLDKAPDFVKNLNHIGHRTMPLSCVYLFPNSEDLQHIDLENEASFKIALPFKDIMSANPESFFDGIESLGASAKYLKSLCLDKQGNLRHDGLVYAKTIEQIQELVNEQIEVTEEIETDGMVSIQKKLIYTMPESVRAKLFSLLKEVFNSKIFDVNTGIASKWFVQPANSDKIPFYPWDACLYCDLVPVLVTAEIKNKKYFPAYFRFILEDLFRKQSESLMVRNETELWIYLDEIKELLKHPIIRHTLRQQIAQARPNRVAFVYATQFFGDIPEEIQLNTDYIISFQQTKTQAKAILENFDSLKYQLDVIRDLKKFQCIVAAKSGEPLVIYDTEGNREVVDDGTPFKGTIFPSVSQHSAPKKEGI